MHRLPFGLVGLTKIAAGPLPSGLGLSQVLGVPGGGLEEAPVPRLAPPTPPVQPPAGGTSVSGVSRTALLTAPRTKTLNYNPADPMFRGMSTTPPVKQTDPNGSLLQSLRQNVLEPVATSARDFARDLVPLQTRQPGQPAPAIGFNIGGGVEANIDRPLDDLRSLAKPLFGTGQRVLEYSPGPIAARNLLGVDDSSITDVNPFRPRFPGTAGAPVYDPEAVGSFNNIQPRKIEDYPFETATDAASVLPFIGAVGRAGGGAGGAASRAVARGVVTKAAPTAAETVVPKAVAPAAGNISPAAVSTAGKLTAGPVAEEAATGAQRGFLGRQYDRAADAITKSPVTNNKVTRFLTAGGETIPDPVGMARHHALKYFPESKFMRGAINTAAETANMFNPAGVFYHGGQMARHLAGGKTPYGFMGHAMGAVGTTAVPLSIMPAAARSFNSSRPETFTRLGTDGKPMSDMDMELMDTRDRAVSINSGTGMNVAEGAASGFLPSWRHVKTVANPATWPGEVNRRFGDASDVASGLYNNFSKELKGDARGMLMRTGFDDDFNNLMRNNVEPYIKLKHEVDSLGRQIPTAINNTTAIGGLTGGTMAATPVSPENTLYQNISQRAQQMNEKAMGMHTSPLATGLVNRDLQDSVLKELAYKELSAKYAPGSPGHQYYKELAEGQAGTHRPDLIDQAYSAGDVEKLRKELGMHSNRKLLDSQMQILGIDSASQIEEWNKNTTAFHQKMAELAPTVQKSMGLLGAATLPALAAGATLQQQPPQVQQTVEQVGLNNLKSEIESRLPASLKPMPAANGVSAVDSKPQGPQETPPQPEIAPAPRPAATPQSEIAPAPRQADLTAESLWGSLGDGSKLLIYGGVGLAVLGALLNIFGGDDDDEKGGAGGMGFFRRVAPLLGIGMAGVGLLGTRHNDPAQRSMVPNFSQLGSSKFWGAAGNDISNAGKYMMRQLPAGLTGFGSKK